MTSYSKKINSYDRIGPEHHFQIDRRATLSDWCMETGTGYTGISVEDLPEGWKQFVFEQFCRFKVPVKTTMFNQVLLHAAAGVIHVIDYFDPYAMLYRMTDVTLDFRWETHTFILDGAEVDVTELDTFRLEPMLAQQTLQDCLAKPGLKALPYEIGTAIKDALDGELYDVDVSHAEQFMSAEGWEELADLCTQNGILDRNMQANYFYLAAWATVCWFLTPEGTRTLVDHSDIMAATYQYGECILYDGYIYTPDCYKVIERPPRTCHQCGLNAWCVEMVAEEGGAAWCCEKCTNEGLPPVQAYMCATKFCKYTVCPHHPFHTDDEHGAGMFTRRHGQLNWLVRGDPELQKTLAAKKAKQTLLE